MMILITSRVENGSEWWGMVVNGDDAGGERRGVNSGEGMRIEGEE